METPEPENYLLHLLLKAPKDEEDVAMLTAVLSHFLDPEKEALFYRWVRFRLQEDLEEMPSPSDIVQNTEKRSPFLRGWHAGSRQLLQDLISLPSLPPP